MFENMLDYLRILLYVALIAVGFLLFQAWEKEHPPIVPVATTQPENPGDRFVPTTVDRPDVPVTQAAATQTLAPVATTTPVAPAAAKGQIVTVTTDVMEAQIDTKGGDIISVRLLKYPESLESKTPYVLLNDDPKTRYIADSGLLSKAGPDTASAEAIYSTAQTAYTLNPDDNSVNVRLDWHNDAGVDVSKTFTFNRASYEVNVKYEVENHSTQNWDGNFYAQLMRTDSPPPSHGGLVNLTTFFGAAVSSPQKPFEKISFSQMQSNPLNQTVQDGWAAMTQHYFVSAWIPAVTQTSNYYTKVLPNGLYAVGLVGPHMIVPPGGKGLTGAKLYAGPIIAKELDKAAPNLKLTIDYGWFWFISVIIFWMMDKINDVVGNWGWSIVLVTVIIKLMFYHLSAKSYRSMSGLKKLQPRIEALKARYGDDRQKLTQATLELYKQEKVNPMSGCLPILIQIPVFIALYWVLVESVQLRQAPWILWIHDLSQKDPYYVLPILMGLSMLVQQLLNPPPPDPMQAKVMLAMPFIFTFLFKDFPAGLMLYWFVNNTLSFLQQWYIMHSLNKETAKRKPAGK